MKYKSGFNLKEKWLCFFVVVVFVGKYKKNAPLKLKKTPTTQPLKMEGLK